MRVGIIGTGAISNKHAQAYKNIGYEVTVCTDIHEPSGHAFAERWSCEFVPTYLEVCRSPKVDYVDLCTFPDFRLDPVKACAEAGKSIQVQKPMSINLETAREMIDIAGKAGIQLGVVSQHRFDDASIFVRKAIDEGKMGTILEADAYVKWYRTPEYYSRPIKGSWATEGGGALINQAVHQVDILLWLIGPVKEVFGMWQLGAMHKIESEDVIGAMFRYRNGAQGVLQSSTAFWPGYTERIEIHGTRGAAILSGDMLTAWDVQDYEGEEPPLVDDVKSAAADPMDIPLTPFERQFADFGTAVKSGTRPSSSGEDGYRALELVLSIYESCRKGEKVVLDG